jgi:hypothetical protein
LSGYGGIQNTLRLDKEIHSDRNNTTSTLEDEDDCVARSMTNSSKSISVHLFYSTVFQKFWVVCGREPDSTTLFSNKNISAKHIIELVDNLEIQI